MKLSSFSLTVLFAVIYIQCISQNASQYQEIWYDDMSSSTCGDWTELYGTIECGYDSNGCHSGLCHKIESESSQGYAALQRITNIASYSSIQIQLSIGAWGMESGDYCNVYFQFDDDFRDDTYNLACGFNPDNGDDFDYSTDQVCNIGPSAVGHSEITIFLENDGSSSDYCYWDNVYLRGISELTSNPTKKPTADPTKKPTTDPTKKPSANPTKNPTKKPTANPTKTPTANPTKNPTTSPTKRPTSNPTKTPTANPTKKPTVNPTKTPTANPTKNPTKKPTANPTKNPTANPTKNPTKKPTANPTKYPSKDPSKSPTQYPTKYPTELPSTAPTKSPSKSPTKHPSKTPTKSPTKFPSQSPTKFPTEYPSKYPTKFPSKSPSNVPSTSPSKFPSKLPTKAPTKSPTDVPTASPSDVPSTSPSKIPSKSPTKAPTKSPSNVPSASPSDDPTTSPSSTPSTPPSLAPSQSPTTLAPTPPGTLACGDTDTGDYNAAPLTFVVNIRYTGDIQFDARNSPLTITSIVAYDMEDAALEDDTDGDKVVTLSNVITGNYKFTVTGDAVASSYDVTVICTSDSPTAAPTDAPSNAPSLAPSTAPTQPPSNAPSSVPTLAPTNVPSSAPSNAPSLAPTKPPTNAPSLTPSSAPSNAPTFAPSQPPTTNPSSAPTHAPSNAPSIAPTQSPTIEPTKGPTTPSPTTPGTLSCGETHTGDYNAAALTFTVFVPYKGRIEFDATNSAVSISSIVAYDMIDTELADDSDGDKIVTVANVASGSYKFFVDAGGATASYDVRVSCASDSPTAAPSNAPSVAPTSAPSSAPSKTPSSAPTPAPSRDPTGLPSDHPSQSPTRNPSSSPTRNPTRDPSEHPTAAPTNNPTRNPSSSPTKTPTRTPTDDPTPAPSEDPTRAPTSDPSTVPTLTPTFHPFTPSPTEIPTLYPTTPDAVVTNYQISIDINCDDSEEDGSSDTQPTSSTACALDAEDINDIVDTIQAVDDAVDIVSVDVVDDDLVVRLSITTDPTKTLKPDVIRSHIEKEVRDNDEDNIWGNVEVDEKDSEFNDLNKDKPHPLEGLLANFYMLAATGATLVICCCGICVTYLVCQQRKTQKQLAQLVNMSSLSGSMPPPGHDTCLSSSADMGQGEREQGGQNRGEGNDNEDTNDTKPPGDGAPSVTTGIPYNAPFLTMPPMFGDAPQNQAIQADLPPEVPDDVALNVLMGINKGDDTDTDEDNSMYKNDDVGVLVTPAATPGGNHDQLIDNGQVNYDVMPGAPVLVTPGDAQNDDSEDENTE